MNNLIEAANSKDDIEIRKHQSILLTSANATLILGVWSFIRTIMFDFTGGSDAELYDGGIIAAITGTLIAITIDMALRLKIVRDARREVEGKGRRKSVYLLIAVLFMLINVGSILINVYAIATKSYDSIVSSIIQMTIETLCIFISFELIYSALRIRKIRAAESLMAGEEIN